jgi:hypothetical protein
LVGSTESKKQDLKDESILPTNQNTNTPFEDVKAQSS